MKCGHAALDGTPDGVQQYIVLEWVCQELDRSRLHRPNRRGHIAVPRDEDNGHVNTIRSDALLQFETIKVRKAYVEYQAARTNDPWAFLHLERAALPLLPSRRRPG